jgi:uncharacterized protein YsxB (DUF464 family)
MIRVTFEENEREGSISLKVKGHSGQAESGKDIVCSAASILAYTVVQAMILCADDLLKEPYIRMEEGDAEITVYPKEDRYGEIYHTFYVAEIGYGLLESNFPQNVTVTLFGQP